MIYLESFKNKQKRIVPYGLAYVHMYVWSHVASIKINHKFGIAIADLPIHYIQASEQLP